MIAVVAVITKNDVAFVFAGFTLATERRVCVVEAAHVNFIILNVEATW